MRLPATFCSLALLAALSGCGSVVIQSNPGVDGGAAPTDTPPMPTDNPSAVDRPPTVLDRPPVPVDVPFACTSASECPRGQACIGPEGCGVPWTCQPALGRPCTEDLAPFCGCDGVTYRGSSSCPARPYLHRGECATAVDGGPGPGACRGNVDCPAGQQCVGPEGCGVPWNCRAVTGCTRDLGPYCGCDGNSFMASSTCPGRPYLHRGACRSATCVIEGVTCRVDEPCAIGACRLCTCGRDGTVGCSLDPACAVDGGFRDGGGATDCTAQDARGVGNCAAFFGYAWDGTRCVGLGGCSCAGSACGSLTFSQQLCEYNYRACL